MTGTTTGGTVCLSGDLICASAAEAAIVRQYLPEHIRLTRAEPGCLSFEVTQSGDPMIWRVAERFADRAAFDAHLETPHLAAFRDSLHLCAEGPVQFFDRVAP